MVEDIPIPEPAKTQIELELERIQHGYRVWANLTFVILALFVLTLIGFAFGGIYAIQQNKHRIADIQQSRVQITFDSCRAQNRRHDNTIEKLDDIYEKRAVGVSAARKMQLAASRSNSLALLNAIVPKVNCHRLVKERYGVDTQ
jgi:hypothetical protein